jgi:hypothetical protein
MKPSNHLFPILPSTSALRTISVGLLMLIGVQCKHYHFTPDNPYGLPNVGTVGAMGCLINGRTWISTPFGPLSSLTGDTVIGIHGSRKGMFYEDIWIGIRLVNGRLDIGVPLVVDTTNSTVSYTSDSTCMGPNPYGLLGRAISGTITVLTFDTVKNEFTGTFSAIIPLVGCDTLKITDGRFGQNFYRQ